MDFDVIGVQQSLGFDEVSQDIQSRRTQLITDSFLTDLADQRAESTRRREGEHMRVASIPAVIVEQWMNDKRRPLNVYDPNVTAKMILARLREDNLEAFIATNKRV